MLESPAEAGAEEDGTPGRLLQAAIATHFQVVTTKPELVAIAFFQSSEVRGAL